MASAGSGACRRNCSPRRSNASAAGNRVCAAPRPVRRAGGCNPCRRCQRRLRRMTLQTLLAYLTLPYPPWEHNDIQSALAKPAGTQRRARRACCERGRARQPGAPGPPPAVSAPVRSHSSCLPCRLARYSSDTPPSSARPRPAMRRAHVSGDACRYTKPSGTTPGSCATIGSNLRAGVAAGSRASRGAAARGGEGGRCGLKGRVHTMESGASSCPASCPTHRCTDQQVTEQIHLWPALMVGNDPKEQIAEQLCQVMLTIWAPPFETAAACAIVNRHAQQGRARAPGVVHGQLHVVHPARLVHSAHKHHAVAEHAALQQPQRRGAAAAALLLLAARRALSAGAPRRPVCTQSLARLPCPEARSFSGRTMCWTLNI